MKMIWLLSRTSLKRTQPPVPIGIPVPGIDLRMPQNLTFVKTTFQLGRNKEKIKGKYGIPIERN
jgi:hypothetical protein